MRRLDERATSLAKVIGLRCWISVPRDGGELLFEAQYRLLDTFLLFKLYSAQVYNYGLCIEVTAVVDSRHWILKTPTS